MYETALAAALFGLTPDEYSRWWDDYKNAPFDSPLNAYYLFSSMKRYHVED